MMQVGQQVKESSGWLHRIGRQVILVSLLALPLSGWSQGTDQKAANTIAIHLDPAATSVQWTLKSLLHNARGSFRLKGADVVTNPATGLAQGEVLIDATSESSGDAGRDAKWQKEILESDTYPAILFHPVKIEGLKAGDGTQQVKASGTLTLKGKDHPIDMMLKVEVAGKHVQVTSHFSIPYAAWGLTAPSSGMMRYDRQVIVDISGKGELKEQIAKPSPAPTSDSQ